MTREEVRRKMLELRDRLPVILSDPKKREHARQMGILDRRFDHDRW